MHITLPKKHYLKLHALKQKQFMFFYLFISFFYLKITVVDTASVLRNDVISQTISFKADDRIYSKQRILLRNCEQRWNTVLFLYVIAYKCCSFLFFFHSVLNYILKCIKIHLFKMYNMKYILCINL